MLISPLRCSINWGLEACVDRAFGAAYALSARAHENSQTLLRDALFGVKSSEENTGVVKVDDTDGVAHEHI
eukprot:6179494-Pleurochrysis_carterae.AAC.1